MEISSGKLLRFVKEFKSPTRSEINKAVNSFSKKEWVVFLVISVIFAASSLYMLNRANQLFMLEVPAESGTISEGIIGTPRFVNPILAVSDADKDLAELVYSGLMRKGGNGELIPDLVENYEISADGKIYTFTLRNNIYFHDNTPVTTDDIIFTIMQIKDPVIKSPKGVSWE